VGVYNSYKIANEHALVILSIRLPYWMFRKKEQYYLCLEDAQVGAVVEQLEKYKNENHYVKPQVIIENEEKIYLHIIAVYLLILITFYLGQLDEPQWYRDKGALDENEVIKGGE